jgi:hypothetical protein
MMQHDQIKQKLNMLCCSPERKYAVFKIQQGKEVIQKFPNLQQAVSSGRQLHFCDGRAAAFDPLPLVVVVARITTVGLPSVQFGRLVHASEQHIERLN